MRAKTFTCLARTGPVARDFIQSARNNKPSSAHPTTESTTAAGALKVLESFRNQRRQQESGYILNGKRVIKAMDEQMQDFSLPFEFTATARSLGRGITEGSLVVIPGDDRVFRVLRIWYEHESVRVGDCDDPRGPQYVVPWRMIRLVQREGDSR
jgi:hypothetical protein